MRWILAATLLFLSAVTTAHAQLSTQCPLVARSETRNPYTIQTSDQCLWVTFSQGVQVQINLPTPDPLVFTQGFTVTLVPLGSNTGFTLTVIPDPQSGRTGKVNGQSQLVLSAAQSVELRIAGGPNWIAKTSGSGSGSGNLSSSGSPPQSNRVAVFSDPTHVFDSGINYLNLLSGTASGNSNQFATIGAAKTANTIAVFDNNGNITSGSGSGIGTVTSVDIANPGGIFSAGGTPVVSAGTLPFSVAGNSGGLPCFTSGTLLSSSAILNANQLVVGGGGGTCPSTIGTSGSANTVLHGGVGFPSFSQIDLGNDVTNQLSLTRIANLPTATVLGNVSGVNASPLGLTGTQVASILDATTVTTKCNAFTSTLTGCVPASGGGTTNFLRADGGFAQPPHTVSVGAGFTTTRGADNTSPVDFSAGNTLFGQIVPKPKTANYTLSFPADINHIFYANGASTIAFSLPSALAGDAACFGDQSQHGFTLSAASGTFYGIGGVSGSSASFGVNASVCAAFDGTNWALTGTASTSSSSLSNVLNNTNIFVGNASNIATGVPVSGDGSITNAGVWTNSKLNGVSYPSSPATNTVPVVTGSNQITYEAVPNGALANSAITIHGTVCTLGTPCLTDANVAYTDASQTFTQHQGVQCVTLVDTTTIAVNNAAANCFRLTLSTSGHTLGAPSNAKTGHVMFWISQPGGGNITMLFASVYKFSGGVVPTLTTTGNAKDLIDCFADTLTTYNCIFVPDFR